MCKPRKDTLEEIKDANTLILHFQLPAPRENKYLLFKLPGLCWLILAALGHEYLEWSSGSVGSPTGPAPSWSGLFFRAVPHQQHNVQDCCTATQGGETVSKPQVSGLHIHPFTKDSYDVA